MQGHSTSAVVLYDRLHTHISGLHSGPYTWESGACFEKARTQHQIETRTLSNCLSVMQKLLIDFTLLSKGYELYCNMASQVTYWLTGKANNVLCQLPKSVKLKALAT